MDITYKDFIEDKDISPESYTWIINNECLNDRTIYCWEFLFVTTQTIYTLITDPSISEEVSKNIRIQDYSDLNHNSIPNQHIRTIVQEVLAIGEARIIY